MGLVALRCVESSWTRCRTCVPCIGRWILIHCTTRAVLCVPLDYALIIVMMIITRLLNAYSVAGTMQSTNRHDHIYFSQQTLKVVYYCIHFTEENTRVPKLKKKFAQLSEASKSQSQDSEPSSPTPESQFLTNILYSQGLC